MSTNLRRQDPGAVESLGGRAPCDKYAIDREMHRDEARFVFLAHDLDGAPVALKVWRRSGGTDGF